MNGVLLISFRPTEAQYISEEAHSLKIKMSLLESQLYPLIIERVQRFHMGNYTCDTAMHIGLLEEKWELIITGVLILSFRLVYNSIRRHDNLVAHNGRGWSILRDHRPEYPHSFHCITVIFNIHYMTVSLV